MSQVASGGVPKIGNEGMHIGGGFIAGVIPFF